MPGTGLAPMLDADRIADLRRLYVLFLRVPDDAGRLALRLALRGDIEERGKEINEGTKDEPGPSQNGEPGMDVDEDVKGKGKAKATGGATALASALRWVQDVLDLKDKFDRVLDQAFSGDKSVQMAINEASVTLNGADPRPFKVLSTPTHAHPSFSPSSSTSILRKAPKL